MRLKMIHIYLLMLALFVYIVIIVHVTYKYGGKTTKSHWKLPRKIFILVSQPRSGSTYLGKVISESINSMYLYEPLYKLDQHFGIDTNFANRSMREKYENFAKISISNMFHCNFEERKELRRLYNSPFKEQSKFSDCDPRKRESPLKKDTQNRKNRLVKFCLPYVNSYSLQEDCHNSNLMVKFLEMRIPQSSINELANLVAQQVEYRIIYLVRDPRASLWSLHRQRWIAESFAHEKFQKYIPKRCDELRKSIASIKSNPNFILIRYEDLVTRPEEIIRQIKPFLEEHEREKIFEKLDENNCYVPPSSLLSNFITDDGTNIGEYGDDKNDEKLSESNVIIEQETLKEKHRRKYQCASINKWRMSATMTFVNMVERKCADVIKTLGYRLVNSDYKILKHIRKSLIEKNIKI